MPHHLNKNTITEQEKTINLLESVMHSIETVLMRNMELEAELHAILREERRSHRSICHALQIYMPGKEIYVKLPGCTCSDVCINDGILCLCEKYAYFTGTKFVSMMDTLSRLEKDGINVGKLYKYVPYTKCKLHGFAERAMLNKEEMEAQNLIMTAVKCVLNKYAVPKQ